MRTASQPGAGFKPAPEFMELIGAAEMAKRRFIAANPKDKAGLHKYSRQEHKSRSQNKGCFKSPLWSYP